jgi:methionyl-tRNA formyltransferase
MSTIAFETLAGRFDLAAVVVPGAPRLRGPRSLLRGWLRRLSRAPLVRLARQSGTPVFFYRRTRVESLARSLARFAPDVVVVATFPALLKPPLLRLARLGAIGLHPSLLPRHRGPEPIFWTYVHDDRETGVTVFALDEGEDTGDVLAQETIPLARGRPAAALYLEMARRGAERLVAVVEDLAAGRSNRGPQDASQATREGLPRPGSFRIDFTSWSCERLWHVLSGLGERARLLFDTTGRPLRHGPARGFALESHGRRPGVIEPTADGWRVYCADGWVDVEPRQAQRR